MVLIAAYNSLAKFAKLASYLKTYLNSSTIICILEAGWLISDEVTLLFAYSSWLALALVQLRTVLYASLMLSKMFDSANKFANKANYIQIS